MCYLFYLLNIRDLIDNLKPWISDSLDMRKSDVSELGVSSICTCNYLYVYVSNARTTMKEIVLDCYLLLSIIMVTCTCNYLYEHVHVCKGYNESKIVLYYNQVIKY